MLVMGLAVLVGIVIVVGLWLSLRGDAGRLPPPVAFPPRADPPGSPSLHPEEGEIPDALRSEVSRHLARGNKIAAIQLYRARTGCGLAEAKSVVERALSELH